MSDFLKHLASSSAECAYVADHEDVFAALSTSVGVWSRSSPEPLPAMAVVVRPDAALIWRVADGLTGNEPHAVALPKNMTPAILRDALYGPSDYLAYVVDIHRLVVQLFTPGIDQGARDRAARALAALKEKLTTVLGEFCGLAALEVPVTVAAHASGAMDVFHDDLVSLQEQLDSEDIEDEMMPPSAYSHVVIDGLSMYLKDFPSGAKPVAEKPDDVSVYLSTRFGIRPRQALALFFERDQFSRRAHRAAIDLMLATYVVGQTGGFNSPLGIERANGDRVATALRALSDATETWRQSEYFVDRD